MTIGLMLTFFDFRNDVRALIKSICINHKVVVFIRKEHEQLIQKFMIPGMECRIIDEHLTTKKNIFYTRLYLLFKRLPKSVKNYYLMEAYKGVGLKDINQRKKAKQLLKYQQAAPHFISYDFYLNTIDYKGKTDLSGVDKMIAFTEIYDDFLFARLVREQIPTQVYVYSWDHACKHVRFSKRVQYLVWNQDIANDVMGLQGVPAEHITIFGSTQLGYIEQFHRNATINQNQNPYFHFGCGIGIPELVEQEVIIIGKLADCIAQVYPDYKLYVRPYPNFSNWAMYDSLLTKSNVVLDNSYKQTDLSIKDEDIISKFISINNAVAFFHLGTTLGLEACFTNTPSFILDITTYNNAAISLYHFIHQYQNEKYLITDNPLNVITSESQLIATLKDIQSDKYLDFNKKTAARFTVQSFDALSAVLTMQV